MGRQPCERRKRLFATEVLSMVGGQGEAEPQKPIWRRVAGFQAAPPRVRRAHLTDPERLGESTTVKESTYMPKFIKKSIHLTESLPHPTLVNCPTR